MPPAFPDRIAEAFDLEKAIDAWNEIPLQNFIHTTDSTIVDNPVYGVSTEEAIENIK